MKYSFKSLCAVIFVIAISVSSSAQSQELSFRFIGNMAFEITDGKTVLYTDFPYTSGSFGYMAYESSEVKPVENALCLITHPHADHWNADLFSKMNAALIAPPETLKKVNSEKKIPFSNVMEYKDLRIEAFSTPHAGEHYSYIVTWHGLRLFFSGDTEDPWLLLASKELDVAFVSPWLLSSVKEQGKTIDARKVVVYHHAAGEKVIPYQDRLVPAQGEKFTVAIAAK